MLAYFEKFVNSLNRPKVYLLLANFLLVFFLIVLSNTNVLPISKIQDFIFFAFIFLIFALYRPGWAFLFFVGTIALENINLAPDLLGLTLRPFQFIGSVTLLAMLIRFASKRINFELPKFKMVDWVVVIFAIAGFFSILGALDRGVSLKQSVIVSTFIALYFLTRIFIQNLEDLKRVALFFLGSSLVVVLYGIWQNIRFSQGLSHFETMPGRPNATFTEADWLGIYLVLLLAILYSMTHYVHNVRDSREPLISNFKFSIFKPCLPAGRNFLMSEFLNFKNLFFYIILSTSYILLILTVSRSAWLGALAVTVVFLLIIFTQLKLNPKNWQWKKTLNIKMGIIISLLVSIGVVYFFHLTTFQLWNRAGSTTSGLQKITISCVGNASLPEKINSTDELVNYNCRHINLEDIQKEKDLGYEIREINRPDPNVNIRAQIYQKSWEVIKENPILGIGWGNSGLVLGTDERGVSLNSSNIFLETWLGSGLFGFLALVYIFIYIFIKSSIGFRTGGSERKIISLFVLLGAIALLIPNLFNAGLFLGILWVFLGIAVSLLESECVQGV